MNTIPRFGVRDAASGLDSEGCCPYIQVFKGGRLIFTTTYIPASSAHARGHTHNAAASIEHDGQQTTNRRSSSEIENVTTGENDTVQPEGTQPADSDEGAQKIATAEIEPKSSGDAVASGEADQPKSDSENSDSVAKPLADQSKSNAEGTPEKVC